MFRHTYQRVALVAIFLLATALVGSIVLAQTASDDDCMEIEFVGVIGVVGANSITINAQVIITTGAEIETALQPGATVRVEGCILADGTIIAREIESPDRGIRPGEVEVIARVNAIAGTTLLAGGQVFDISGADVSAGIMAGDLVRIRAVRSDGGIWVAREVRLFTDDDDDDDDSGGVVVTPEVGDEVVVTPEVDDDDDDDFGDNDFSITGTLEAVSEGAIVVSGQVIDISSAQISTPLIVGAIVRVRGVVIDGRFIASEVRMVRQDSDDDDDDDFSDVDDDDDGFDDFDDDDDDDNGTVGCVISPPAGWVTYTVRRGDALSSIAARSGSTVEELMRVNCIDNPRFIVAGARIFVPREIAPPAAPPPPTSGGSGGSSFDDDDDGGSPPAPSGGNRPGGGRPGSSDDDDDDGGDDDDDD